MDQMCVKKCLYPRDNDAERRFAVTVGRGLNERKWNSNKDKLAIPMPVVCFSDLSLNAIVFSLDISTN